MTCLIGSFKVRREAHKQWRDPYKWKGIYARTWLNCSQVAHSICQNERNFTM